MKIESETLLDNSITELSNMLRGLVVTPEAEIKIARILTKLRKVKSNECKDRLDQS